MKPVTLLMIGIALQKPRLLDHGTINCIPLRIPAHAGLGEDGLAAFSRVPLCEAIGFSTIRRGARELEQTY